MTGDFTCTDPDSNPQTITCSLANLAADSSASITVTYSVAASTAAATAVPNTANAASDEDAALASTDSVEIITRADVANLKLDTPEPVIAGNTITYTLIITNNGPSDAVDAQVINSLSSDVENARLCDADADDCTTDESNFSPYTSGTPILLGTMTPGQVRTIVIKADVLSSVADGETIINTSYASSDTTDPDTTNNDAEATTAVIAVADLSVEKTDSPDPVTAGTT